MKRTANLSSHRLAIIGVVLVVALLFPLIVFADQVVNNIDTTIDPGREQVEITAGGSVSVGFYIQPSNTPSGDAPGCNATGAAPATVTLSIPAGVSASPTSLTFRGCETVQNVSFSSNTPGDYTITVASVTGGKSGSLWDTAPAEFTLRVLAPPPPTDTTPPVITPNVSGTLGNNGWYTSDVTVSWSVVDNESAVSSTSGCGSTTINTDTDGVTLTCTATSAGGTSSQSVTVKRDATPPTISVLSLVPASPAASGWYNISTGAPTVSFTCGDATGPGSGLATCPANHTFGEGAGQSHTGTAYDNAGNSASAGVSGINVDLTAPTVTITTPPSGASYLLNAAVNADYSCSDAGSSGLASCAGPVASGSPISTAPVGAKTFTVNAADNAGNTNSATHNYSVVYDYYGFFAPVDTSALNVVQAGRAIPVKFSLTGYQGMGIFWSGFPQSRQIACDTSLPADAVEQTLTAGASGLNYDSLIDQYNYIWKTERGWAGTCRQLVIKLNDGTTHVANFRFNK